MCGYLFSGGRLWTLWTSLQLSSPSAAPEAHSPCMPLGGGRSSQNSSQMVHFGPGSGDNNTRTQFQELQNKHRLSGFEITTLPLPRIASHAPHTEAALEHKAGARRNLVSAWGVFFSEDWIRVCGVRYGKIGFIYWRGCADIFGCKNGHSRPTMCAEETRTSETPF